MPESMTLCEERRQRALDLPLATAESPASWDAGFADLSDEDMDELFGAASNEIRSARQE